MDIAPTTRAGEILPVEVHLDLLSSASQHPEEVYQSDPIVDVEVSTDMDTSLPSTPSSATSPTASEQSSGTTCTSPASPLQPIWNARNVSIQQYAPTKLEAPTIRCPMRPKTAWQFVRESPTKGSFLPDTHCSNVAIDTIRKQPLDRSHRNRLNLRNQTHNLQPDEDGDVQMESPCTATSAVSIGGSIAEQPRCSESNRRSSIVMRDIESEEPRRTRRNALRICDLLPLDAAEMVLRRRQRHRRASCSPHRSRGNCADRGAVGYRDEVESRSRSQSRCNNKHDSTVKAQPTVPSIQIPDNRQILRYFVHHLSTPLVPLISVTTGLAHPEFPRSILQFHLLTHDQLDSLARWYHQTIDNTREKYHYPAVIERPWAWSNEQMQRAVETQELERGLEVKPLDLATKRRRFGRFIGLRGNETASLASPGGQDEEKALADRLEREWKNALRRAEEEAQAREKTWRGRW